MADGQLNLTRRALLGTACVPVLRGPGAGEARGPLHQPSAGPPPRPGEDWERALARFRAAEAALAAVAHTEDDRLYDRHLGRFNGAMKRLLRTAAPDLGALAAKLDLIVAQEAWELTGGERCIAALQRDAHRFAAAAR